jgi:hypothetical protein
VEAGTQRHPIGLIVTDNLTRSRLTVFFRLLLAIPHLIVLYLWGIVTDVVLVVAWVVALVLGRLPAGLHNFLAGYLGYATRVTAYLFLLAEPWPPFGTKPYPIDVRVDPPSTQNRLTVFFRLLLALPAGILSAVFRTVNTLLAIFGWFYCLALGQMHEGMRNLSAWMLKYEAQTYAYVFLLTSREAVGVPVLPPLGGGRLDVLAVELDECVHELAAHRLHPELVRKLRQLEQPVRVPGRPVRVVAFDDSVDDVMRLGGLVQQLGDAVHRPRI